MKNNLIIGAVALSAFAPAAFAHKYCNDAYVGVEVIQTNQDYKEGFGKKVFKRDPQDYSVFAGFSFNKWLGTEFGYEWQPKRNRTVTLTAGDSTPGGAVITGSSSAMLQSSISGYHPYIGLFAENRTKWSMGWTKFQVLVAASVSRVKANANLVKQNGFGITPVIRTYSKTKVVPMVKLSATHSVTQRVGVRLSVNYRNLESIKMAAKEGGTGMVKMKDTWGVGLGLTYSFN